MFIFYRLRRERTRWGLKKRHGSIKFLVNGLSTSCPVPSELVIAPICSLVAAVHHPQTKLSLSLRFSPNDVILEVSSEIEINSSYTR